eukprot:CAMPEP_0181274504 /NCGR_PEP_ID=MMETSP1097-20121128/9291_1 /TAXON_ID=35684 /ORGANISM="Pseudopedinella elastica, Strain CCMP716" /LENGTH=55 /DNA_ID=CAMNT_0023375647 /DNA_START=130 /DNA_END=294 /DNA_ORIENTATION=+
MAPANAFGGKKAGAEADADGDVTEAGGDSTGSCGDSADDDEAAPFAPLVTALYFW